MPSGAAGRLTPSRVRQTPACEEAKASLSAAVPEKNVRCIEPAPERSARSDTSRPPSAPCGTEIPIISQIRANAKGPEFLKKRGSAIFGMPLFLRRRRLGVEIDLKAGQLLVQPVDGFAGDVKAA